MNSNKINLFLHIPKTGGNTIRNLLIREYGQSNVSELYPPQYNILAGSTPLDAKKIINSVNQPKAVIGHFKYGLHKYLNSSYRYIILFREPVARVVSEYNHLLRSSDKIHKKLLAECNNIKEYTGIKEMNNFQTQLVAGCSYREVLGYPEQMLELAKTNLHHNFVIILEKFDESLVVIKELLDWQDIRYRESNIASKQEYIRPSEAEKEAIREKNYLDIELYNYATQIFKNNIKKIDNFQIKLKNFQKDNHSVATGIYCFTRMSLIKVNSFIKKVKQMLVGDYSPDIALRYLPVVDIIKKEQLANKNILEFGSGDLGITTYLKTHITGLDLSFGGSKNNYIKQVKYDGLSVPFHNNEFDLVLSVDSLEHVEKDKRQHIINEMLRVSKKGVIIIVPSGKLAEEHDRELAKYFFRIHKKTDRFFDDHLKNGLPKTEEIIKMCHAAAGKTGKKIFIKRQKKILNLKLREIMMKCKISNNIFLSIMCYIFLALLPFRNLLNFGNCYRQLFFITIIKK